MIYNFRNLKIEKVVLRESAKRNKETNDSTLSIYFLIDIHYIH